MPKHFIRKKENFICDCCKTKIIGNGYTNHCPSCLYSKHVDKEVPGDRLSSCKSLMNPIKIEIVHGKYYVVHQCNKCGKIIKNKTDLKDNFEKIIEISEALF